MVLVNFRIAMVAAPTDAARGLWGVILEGRAAATFVVLAGIGLGLSARGRTRRRTRRVTLVRSLFLLVLGLLNTVVFDADILHYYAFYFLFGALCVGQRRGMLLGWIAVLNVAFFVLLITLDYEAGWNFDELTYRGLWTVRGFTRSLFFNGWHPVVPWLSFLIFGLLLSRLDLRSAQTQTRLWISGIVLFAVAEGTSRVLGPLLAGIDPELEILATTEPMPPLPLYMLAGAGAASAVTGVCLRLEPWLRRTGLLDALVPAGRQTLTLYLAHILVGLGTLEALGLLGDQSLPTSVLASSLFLTASVIFAWLWSRRFSRGPIESVMHWGIR
ncbi:MAG: DUF418 domain-containing protein [Planctomycetes bacterium]|nr:DUF418 domain-containing protein [Planctomycetota bacterium]